MRIADGLSLSLWAVIIKKCDGMILHFFLLEESLMGRTISFFLPVKEFLHPVVDQVSGRFQTPQTGRCGCTG